MSDNKRSDIISTSPSSLIKMFRTGLLRGAGYIHRYRKYVRPAREGAIVD